MWLRLKEVRRILAKLALTGASNVVLLPALLWLEQRTELTLPATTGPFAVGRATYAGPTGRRWIYWRRLRELRASFLSGFSTPQRVETRAH
jgi:hypothetical protein